MTTLYPWDPDKTDYAVAPGETIQECLDVLGYTTDDLAKYTGLSVQEVDALISGTVTIDEPLAEKLEEMLQPPAQIWLNLEQQYRRDLARLAARTRK